MKKQYEFQMKMSILMKYEFAEMEYKLSVSEIEHRASKIE
jgi:hypothetical protein